jgi:hypothetical protein
MPFTIVHKNLLGGKEVMLCEYANAEMKGQISGKCGK